MLHLLEEELGGKLKAFQLFDREEVKKTDLVLLQAFFKKNPGAALPLLAPVMDSWKDESIRIDPWEWMFG